MINLTEISTFAVQNCHVQKISFARIKTNNQERKKRRKSFWIEHTTTDISDFKRRAIMLIRGYSYVICIDGLGKGVALLSRTNIFFIYLHRPAVRIKDLFPQWVRACHIAKAV